MPAAIWIIGGLIAIMALDQAEETVDAVGDTARNDLLPIAAVAFAAWAVMRK